MIFTRAHSAHVLDITFSNGGGFVSWSALDQLDRTNYNYLFNVSASTGFNIVATGRFADDGLTLGVVNSNISETISIQIYVIGVRK